MEPFTLTIAHENKEAIDAISTDSSAKAIGGGTNLLDLMKMYVERPHQLVDITSLPLNRIEPLSNGGVNIGALVRNSDLAYDPIIAKKYPVLSQALLSGATAQLRNMATTGGNILQRTRCQYFFNTSFPCNKRDPGSGCSAINGFNRIHAVLGTSDKCIASHPSDMCVALAALDAIIHIEGPKGKRMIPFTEFHLLPGQTPEKENLLEHGELITSVEIPDLPFATRSYYLKVRNRASFDFALTSAAVILDLNGSTIRSARIALGGVGTKPWRSFEAEKILSGVQPGEHAFTAAADAAMKEAKPFRYNAFKIELMKKTLVRALTITGGLK